MRRLAAVTLSMAVAGCASLQGPTCPQGQESLRTAELFLGARGRQAPSDAELKRFVADEVTRRFSSGVTVLDGGAQWRGAQEQWMREAAKVVMIVLPPGPLTSMRLGAISKAYRKRFGHDPAGVFVRQSCVAF
jgi:hypothetical protein